MQVVTSVNPLLKMTRLLECYKISCTKWRSNQTNTHQNYTHHMNTFPEKFNPLFKLDCDPRYFKCICTKKYIRSVCSNLFNLIVLNVFKSKVMTTVKERKWRNKRSVTFVYNNKLAVWSISSVKPGYITASSLNPKNFSLENFV